MIDRHSQRVRGRRPLIGVVLAAALATSCAGPSVAADSRGPGATGTDSVTTAPNTSSATSTTDPPRPTTTTTPTTTQATTSTSTTTAPAPIEPGTLALPEPLPTEGGPRFPGEGEWMAVGPPGQRHPLLAATTVRTRSGNAAFAWIDTTGVRGQLFPGTAMPGGTWSVPSMVPAERRPALRAAFNGGFLLSECHGGWFLDGRAAVPLKDGSAAVAIDAEGTISVGQLGRDIVAGPTTVAVRQNLGLLVDGGVVSSSATDRDTSVWGATLGGRPFVWRSGLGQRADGSLVYVAGPGLSARMLGDLLVTGGAVRALELDINPTWVTFNTYSFDGATNTTTGTKLDPAMTQPGDRYLTPDTRDFFAIFAR